ncbi:Hypothetical protein NTJ_00095 [Nesidiocoris tenuis]|uniref:Uncharacterized protein n=1 Tax=Nesidiocoris tenuis TaxID=355587 RepID=A0ABN7A5H2_9HEMI|nr:Hypothetical protein NTJ_00095 [Nesidiocoris tenuis]
MITVLQSTIIHSMIVCILLALAVHPAVPHRLPASHEQGGQIQHKEVPPQEAHTVNKRNINPIQGFPSFGFLPVVAPSQSVIQVHHYVHLQPPAGQCPPAGRYLPPQGMFARYPPSPPTDNGGTNNGDDLLNRMGGGNNNQTAGNEPSPCVWAIVSCCSPGNRNIRYACFELLGCQGAFWDLSPCEPRVVQAAANTALMFYMKATPPASNQSNVIDFDVPEETDITNGQNNEN